MRAFARDLNLAPSRLSEILNGKQGLSIDKARAIALALKLSETETQLMLDSVEHLHSKNPQKRREAGHRLNSRASTPDYVSLSNDSFKAVSDWYHLAIVQLLELDGFDPSPVWIANALGIKRLEAKAALDRLIRLGVLVVLDGKVQAPSGFVSVSDGTQSEAVQSFHRQILYKALDALTNQSVDERDFSTSIFTMQKEDFRSACDSIKSFRRALSEAMSGASKKDDLYSLSVQLVKITQNSDNNKA